MPTVSVLMPSYNHAAYLPAALERLQAQTLSDWELIAVDDGSTDTSVRILSETGDPRIQVSQNETNLGTYGTLKRALSMASSDLIAVLNSDDEWDATKLELQVEALEKHAEAQFCYTDGRSIGDTSRPGDVQGDWPRSEVQELIPFLLQENRILASSVVFRKPFVAFDASMRYSGDWEALLRPARNARVAFVDTPLTSWRIHDRNTFVRSKGQVAEEIRLRQSILSTPDYWKKPGVPAQAIQDGLSKCAMHLSALYVLEGRMREARLAARLALSLRKSPETLKRFAVVYLSQQVAQSRLWPNEGTLTASEKSTPIAFP